MIDIKRLISLDSYALILTFVVDYNHEEGYNTEPNMYSQQGKRFFPRRTSHGRQLEHIKTILGKTSVNTSLPIEVRREEPELGAIVYIESLEIFEKYLVGPPRHPFRNPIGNFVIIFSKHYDDSDVYQLLAANVMKILWEDYRVLNVILILSCNINKVYKRNITIRMAFYVSLKCASYSHM